MRAFKRFWDYFSYNSLHYSRHVRLRLKVDMGTVKESTRIRDKSTKSIALDKHYARFVQQRVCIIAPGLSNTREYKA